MSAELEMVRGFVEMKQKQYSISFAEAAKLVASELSFPNIKDLLNDVVKQHNDEVQRLSTITDLSTSSKKDHSISVWYAGPQSDDVVWTGLKHQMTQNGLGGAISDIDESTTNIVRRIAEPGVPQDRRRGLVIGNVQSGKTANYSAVIAKALDVNYRMVIVLSGIHNNLRRQTQSRLTRDLGIDSDWYTLTSEDADFGTDSHKNAGAIVKAHDRILAVVKKNSRRLENLRRFLNTVPREVLAKTPILIIDDESDQATPDSSARNAAEPTAINRLMKQIWAQVVNGTYIGYTATPFANVFMDPEDSEELYPSNFIHVMNTPKDYFGAERIFGLNTDSPDLQSSRGLDVVRHIPAAEKSLLVPKGNKAAAEFAPTVTDSLGDAVRWFIIASAIRRLRGQAHKHSTMLIHTTHYVQPHFRMREAVEDFTNALRRKALQEDVESFRSLFLDEFPREASLHNDDGPTITWPKVAEELVNVLTRLSVSVDNGEADVDERLTYPDDEPQTVIVIGGGTLSRGLTLEGLFVSFFTRSSNTYDTLLQMGRWFGYRKGYEDLQRIWVSDKLAEDYRFLALVEAEMRQEVQNMIVAGKTPAEIGVRIRQHPGRLQITSKNKMKQTDQVEVDFEGYRLQTYKFDLSSEQRLAENVSAATALVDAVKQRKVDAEAKSHLFNEVPLGTITAFVRSFKSTSEFDELVSKAISWAEDKLPNTSWNVVLQSTGGHDWSPADGIVAKQVDRAPIRNSDDGKDALGGASVANIRTLMAGEDLIADLKILENASNRGTAKRITIPEDPFNVQNARKWRRNADLGAGRGLLILYPISRRSGEGDYNPVNDRQLRTPMSSAIEGVQAVVGSDAAEISDNPIMGYALVMPHDIQNAIVNKGTFVAVTPKNSMFDDDEVDESASVDNEADYNAK